MLNKLGDKIKDILNNMEISKAIIIDDKINMLSNEEDILISIINGQYDDINFDIVEELNTLGYFNVGEIKELAVEGKLHSDIISMCKEKLPSLFKKELGNFLDALNEIFGKENIIEYESTNKVEGNPFTSDTILFLDYQLDGTSPDTSENLAKVLAEKGTDNNNPRCIVFISNSRNFIFKGQTFDMTQSVEKYKYFKELRTEQSEANYKNSLYDFIPKQDLDDISILYNSLYNTLNNLYSGQTFYKLLFQINEILSVSSKEVLGKFHLLNARSIQEILQNKVAIEGISEPVFFMEWISRHIAKSVAGNDKFIKDIHNTLNIINELPEPFNELHEDIALIDMLNSEMWDSRINERFDPISFGDVFEIDFNGNKTRAILLTQPCTLAVRGDGSRSGKIGMLVMENKDKNGSKSPAVFRDYTDWKGENIIFCFDETVTFCLELLDLTTLNKDGQAIITIDDSKNIEFPDCYWSKGYRKKIESIVNNVYKKLSTVSQGIRFIQVDQTWMPFEVNKSDTKIRYEFPVKRLFRLDYQYTLNLFQKAQAWWGRIGLPANLNFLDGYREIKGSVCINNSKEMSMIFWVKEGVNEYDEVQISIDELEKAILEIYEPHDELCVKIKQILSRNIIARVNCRSGKRLISLKRYTNGIEELIKNNIDLKLYDDQYSGIKLDVKVAIFLKYVFNNKDITNDIEKEAFIERRKEDLAIKCNFYINNLQEFKLEQDKRLSKKIGSNEDGCNYLRFSNLEMDSIFDTKIVGNELVICTKEEVAAANEN